MTPDRRHYRRERRESGRVIREVVADEVEMRAPMGIDAEGMLRAAVIEDDLGRVGIALDVDLLVLDFGGGAISSEDGLRVETTFLLPTKIAEALADLLARSVREAHRMGGPS